MNSVHEQCPISDSETVLSPKTRSKLSQVHRAPNLAQPVHTSAPRRVRVALSWRPQPAMSRSVVGPNRLCLGRRAPCHRRAGGRVVVAAWPCRRRCPCAVSWPGWPCRKTPQLANPPPPPPPPPPQVTIH